MSDRISAMARFIGVADLPWGVRISLGLLIALIILYILALFLPVWSNGKDSSSVKSFRDWLLDAAKVVFGAVVGLISKGSGVAEVASAINNPGGAQSQTLNTAGANSQKS